MTDTMGAVEVVDGRCTWGRAPVPEVGPGQIRIDVHAAGVNRADLVQKAGRYPPPRGASRILGLEVSGVVAARGEGVDRWRVGDPVCALLAGGGYAEQVVVDADHAAPLPDGRNHVEAAAIVEVFATAWLNLGRLAGLADRDARASVVIHAGASGVGTAGVQLCRMWGHDVFVTVGSPDKVSACRALGAVGGVDRHTGSWRDAVAAWRPDGVDVILDPVGAGYLPDDLDVLGPDGVLVLIGLLSGREATIDLGKVLMKRLRVQGSTLRARDAAFKAQLLRELEDRVWPRFADDTLKPIVDRTFPITEAEAAHAHLESNDTVGAVVLEVGR